jgi:hypothetical protein
VLAEVAARAVRDLGKDRPRVAVSYAPVAGDEAGLRFMSERMPRLFPGAVLEAVVDDRSVVDRADLAFVSGGDPVLGARVLQESGAAAWLREASARGTPMMGVSAGAIVLGAWWADWPEDDDPELERTELLECSGVLARQVFDTHDEEDGWGELHTVARLLERRGLLQTTRITGIPTGGAVVYGAADVGDGEPEVVGNPPFRLR